LTGCGDSGIKKITVNGSVEYKGKRLSSGMLQFHGPDGAYSASMIQTDGTYIMTDVVPGETKIAVMNTPQGTDSSSGKGTSSAKGPPPIELPDKYRNADTSGVKYTITPETRELHIEIK
jgi:hypothetical protein